MRPTRYHLAPNGTREAAPASPPISRTWLREVGEALDAARNDPNRPKLYRIPAGPWKGRYTTTPQPGQEPLS